MRFCANAVGSAITIRRSAGTRSRFIFFESITCRSATDSDLSSPNVTSVRGGRLRSQSKEFDMTLIVTFIASLFLAFPQTAAPRPAGERFDLVVRGDFFAGFAGDRARLAKGMEACERVLAESPNHAEALVWHGSGLAFSAGMAFQKGDMKT